MATPVAARYRARRDDKPDLGFVGIKLAEVEYEDGDTDRLFRTEAGKIVYSTKVDDATGTHHDAVVFDNIDDFIKSLEAYYGAYSYRMKDLLAQAARVDDSLRKYFVDEI